MRRKSNTYDRYGRWLSINRKRKKHQYRTYRGVVRMYRDPPAYLIARVPGDGRVWIVNPDTNIGVTPLTMFRDMNREWRRERSVYPQCPIHQRGGKW